MMQSNTIILENKEEYNIINKLVYNEIEYLLLSNISNVKDICIRKIVKDDINKYVCRLDKNEFDIIFDMFTNPS